MEELKRLLEFVGVRKTPDEQAICKAAFDAILGGESIDHAGLVTTTGLSQAQVSTLLTGVISRGLVVIEPSSGRIVGSWGLSLVPTPHRLRIRGRELYAWCAMDAVGIPAGLAEDARVTSVCHQCGVALNMELTGGEVVHAESSKAQLWLTACQAGQSVVGFT
jgi:alkylmercury lyase